MRANRMFAWHLRSTNKIDELQSSTKPISHVNKNSWKEAVSAEPG